MSRFENVTKLKKNSMIVMERLPGGNTQNLY